MWTVSYTDFMLFCRKYQPPNKRNLELNLTSFQLLGVKWQTAVDFESSLWLSSFKAPRSSTVKTYKSKNTENCFLLYHPHRFRIIKKIPFDLIFNRQTASVWLFCQQCKHILHYVMYSFWRHIKLDFHRKGQYLPKRKTLGQILRLLHDIKHNFTPKQNLKRPQIVRRPFFL